VECQDVKAGKGRRYTAPGAWYIVRWLTLLERYSA
jgi:hypothetical protein